MEVQGEHRACSRWRRARYAHNLRGLAGRKTGDTGAHGLSEFDRETARKHPIQPGPGRANVRRLDGSFTNW